MTTESQDNNKRVFRVAQGDSQTPENREALLIQQGIFDYNMNTTVAGMAEDKAMDEAVRYFQALIVAAEKALLSRIERELGLDVESFGSIPAEVVKAAIEAERQQLGKEGSNG